MSNRRRVPADPRQVPITKTRLDGALVIGRTSLGGWRASKWPRKRGKPKNPNVKYQSDAFAFVAKGVSKVSSDDRLAAIEASVGTIYTWRDLFMKASFGNLVTLSCADGTYWTGWAMAVNDLQALLNSLTPTLGCMVVYTQNGWVALAPGSSGTVLTSVSKEDVPVWQTPAVGGAGLFAANTPIGGVTTTAYSAKGGLVQPLTAFKVKGLGSAIYNAEGKTVRMGLYATDGDTITAVLATTDLITIAGSGKQEIYSLLSDEVTLEANTLYAMLTFLDPASQSSELDVYTGTNDLMGAPVAPLNQYARLTGEVPAVGSAIGTGAVPYYWSLVGEIL